MRDDADVGVQGEVELMKKLHHENIVQYVDTIRTDEHLYIALEYVFYCWVPSRERVTPHAIPSRGMDLRCY